MEASPPAATPFFGPGSPYLTHPLLTEERTAREIDQIESLVGAVERRLVLDVGCGFGRHSIELARRGAYVTGVDPSQAMVEAARERIDAAGVFADIAHARTEDLGDVAHFDLALCLFTTLGQRDPSEPESWVTDDAERVLLAAVRRTLRPGAALVVELPDRDRTVAAMVEQEQLGPTSVGRCFDPAASLFTERFDLEDGRSFDLAYRLYDCAEVTVLLTESGFEVEHVADGPLVSPPPNLVTFVARRRR